MGWRGCFGEEKILRWVESSRGASGDDGNSGEGVFWEEGSSRVRIRGRFHLA